MIRIDTRQPDKAVAEWRTQAAAKGISLEQWMFQTLNASLPAAARRRLRNVKRARRGRPKNDDSSARKTD